MQKSAKFAVKNAQKFGENLGQFWVFFAPDFWVKNSPILLYFGIKNKEDLAQNLVGNLASFLQGIFTFFCKKTRHVCNILHFLTIIFFGADIIGCFISCATPCKNVVKKCNKIGLNCNKSIDKFIVVMYSRKKFYFYAYVRA